MRRRNVLISTFVIIWTLVFQYETLRHFYLSPLAGRPLPKLPLLFPPAGWIMFFNVDLSYGFAEVYGVRGSEITLLDPHDILRTKAVLYDNIHRNVLVSVLDNSDLPWSQNPWRNPAVDARLRAVNDPFCRFLRRRFPRFERFGVVHAAYPGVVSTPERILRQALYTCD
jgi:hypothetical protein